MDFIKTCKVGRPYYSTSWENFPHTSRKPHVSFSLSDDSTAGGRKNLYATLRRKNLLKRGSENAQNWEIPHFGPGKIYFMDFFLHFMDFFILEMDAD